MLDLSAYFRRVGYSGEAAANEATLNALHLAHATHIPFENLDILLGRSISLDLARIQTKLVQQRRGGYCFEQNTLFASALRQLGFSVTALAARVRYRQTALLPRTHMCLCVRINGRDWISDVGFGGEGLLMPVPMTGQPVTQYLWTYRVTQESPGVWVLQSLRHKTWSDLYVFSLEPQEAVDFELANYYVSTHPQSQFVRSLTVQLPSPERRQILRNRELTIDTGNATGTAVVEGAQALMDVLRDNFHLEFPPGADFRYLVEKWQARAADR